MFKTVLKIKEFELEPGAKRAGLVTELLQSFGNQREVGNIFRETQEQLLDLLSLSKGVSRREGQNSYGFNKSGIGKMFSIMSHNQAMTAAPESEVERQAFYKKLAYGYQFVAEAIKEEFEGGKLDKEDVCSCLDLIGEGGYACAGRWRSVLEELVGGFSYKLKVAGMAEENQKDRLKEQVGELFFNSRVIEGNKASEEFVNTYFPDMYVGNRVHYTSFFKRTLNALLDYELPATMEEDSYIQAHQGEIFKDIQRYLKTSSLDHLVVERVLSLVQENIKTDSKLYEAVVNDAIGQYGRSRALGEKYEDATEFMSKEIFQGYSKEIKKEALLEILKHKGFIKEIEKEKAIVFNIKSELSDLLDSDIPSRNIETLLEKLKDEATFFKKISPILRLKNEQGENLLLSGIKNKMPNLTKFLLKQNIDLGHRDKNGNTALHWASLTDNEEVVELLKNKGADLNIQCQKGNTALIKAIEEGHLELAELLISSGANLNTQSNHGNTALIQAIKKGHTEMAKLLISSGADLEIVDKDRCSALHWAVHTKNTVVLEFLIEKGVKLNTQNKNGRTALSYAAARGDLQAVELLIKKRADLNIQGVDGATALIQSIEKGYTQISKLLIAQGADLNIQDENGNTALIHGGNRGHTTIVKLLIAQGADLNILGEKGKSALIQAIEKDQIGLAKLFIATGADLNIQDKDGNTALIKSIDRDQTDLAAYLIAWDSPLDIQGQFERTALFCAIDRGHTELAKLLLEKGADFKLGNKNGTTALHWAAHKNDEAMVDILVKKGGEVNKQNVWGYTPLCYAAEKGNLGIAKLLIKYRADLNLPDMDGNTALHIALDKGYIDLAKHLIEAGADLELKNHRKENPLTLARKWNNKGLNRLIQEKRKEQIRPKMTKENVGPSTRGGISRELGL